MIQFTKIKEPEEEDLEDTLHHHLKMRTIMIKSWRKNKFKKRLKILLKNKRKNLKMMIVMMKMLKRSRL